LITLIFFLESNTFVAISEQLFSIRIDVSVPRQSSVEVDTQVFGSFSLWNLVSIQSDYVTCIKRKKFGEGVFAKFKTSVTFTLTLTLSDKMPLSQMRLCEPDADTIVDQCSATCYLALQQQCSRILQ
jgi:hypothetical protein